MTWLGSLGLHSSRITSLTPAITTSAQTVIALVITASSCAFAIVMRSLKRGKIMPPGPDVVEVLANSIGQYFWRVRAANGKTIATSGESFDSKYNAKRAAERMLGIDFPEDTDEMDLAVNVVTPDPGPPVEEGPTLRSTFRGVCSWCGEAIHFGMLVKVDNEGSFQHENCFEISLGEAPQ